MLRYCKKYLEAFVEIITNNYNSYYVYDKHKKTAHRYITVATLTVVYHMSFERNLKKFH